MVPPRPCTQGRGASRTDCYENKPSDRSSVQRKTAIFIVSGGTLVPDASYIPSVRQPPEIQPNPPVARLGVFPGIALARHLAEFIKSESLRYPAQHPRAAPGRHRLPASADP